MYYTGAHFFLLHNPTLLSAALSKNAWVLVDSNVGNLNPQAVIAIRFALRSPAVDEPSDKNTRLCRDALNLPCKIVQIKQRTGAELFQTFSTNSMSETTELIMQVMCVSLIDDKVCHILAPPLPLGDSNSA